jgi:hypothetical protein
MSIGEIVNLYRDKELVIRPEFQRLFRWTKSQQSRLIESILLGIPLPSIFVMQRHDGVWEVIDGLQRLSTILGFMGELRDEGTGLVLPPNRLSGTEYLPSLEGVAFESESENDALALTSGQRINFKRSKIDLNILLPESDEKAKYELFDRLNTGGSPPTPQEVRNAQLIMRDSSFFEWMESLRSDDNFQNSIGISNRRYDESYDAELVTRFFVLLNTPGDSLKGIKDNIDTFLSREIFQFVDSGASFDREFQGNLFKSTFKLINDAAGDNSFRRFDIAKGRFTGPFSVGAFEAITVGVGTHCEAWAARSDANEALLDLIQGLWTNSVFKNRSGSGISSAQRIPYTVPEARNYFAAQ